MKLHKAVADAPLPPGARLRRDAFGYYRAIKDGRLIEISRGTRAADGLRLAQQLNKGN